MNKSSKKLHHSVSSKKNPESLGMRLKYAIKLLGYSQAGEFAKKHQSEIKKSTFYAVLNNQTKNPGSSILEVLQRAGINVTYLLTGDGEPLLREAGKSDESEMDNQSLKRAIHAVLKAAGRKNMEDNRAERGEINAEIFEPMDLVKAMRRIFKDMETDDLEILLDSIKANLSERKNLILKNPQ